MADDARLYDKGLAERREVQTTVYCGVPAALESFRIAAEILKEEDAKNC
jgi:alkylhydroperoxidase/carboxymuconolactone decarboxylase family protein YurZ